MSPWHTALHFKTWSNSTIFSWRERAARRKADLLPGLATRDVMRLRSEEKGNMRRTRPSRRMAS